MLLKKAVDLFYEGAHPEQTKSLQKKFAVLARAI